MEDTKTIIDKVKELVFGEETVEVKLEDLKDVDGNIIRVMESVEIGAEVSLVSEDGSLNPLVDSEIELEDGRVLKTDAEGKISEIVEVDSDDDDMKEHDEKEKENEAAVESEMESVETDEAKEETKEVETETKEETVELSDTEKELTERLEKLEADFAKLSKQPAEKEIKVEKSAFTTKVNKNDLIDDLSKFRSNK